MKIFKFKRFSEEKCQDLPDYLFIFGDNLMHHGRGGQAIIRNEPNTYGIPTKKLPSRTKASYFDDSEYESNIDHIKRAIDGIPMNYAAIVFPEDGLGTGLAELPTRAPRTYKFLVDSLNEKFGKIYD